MYNYLIYFIFKIFTFTVTNLLVLLIYYDIVCQPYNRVLSNRIVLFIIP